MSNDVSNDSHSLIKKANDCLEYTKNQLKKSKTLASERKENIAPILEKIKKSNI